MNNPTTPQKPHAIVRSPGGFLEKIVSRHSTRFEAETQIAQLPGITYRESPSEVWADGYCYAVCYRP